jgi:hypothetical protein
MIQNVWLRAGVDVHTEGLINQTDDTTSFHLSGAYRTERMEGGIQFMYRHRGGENRFDLYALDGAFDLGFGPIGVAGEVIAQFGNGNLEGGVNDVNLLAVGAALNLGVHTAKIDAGADLGIATGDGDPTDTRLRSFAFDRDFNVGFIMFEQPMPTLAAVNPEDEDGRVYDQTLTGNAVSNALYLKPRISYQIIPGLWADASVLTARAAKLSPEDKEVGRSGYGYEFDLGARYQAIDHFTVGATFGAFLPGKYYRNYTDDTFQGFKAPVYGAQFIGRIDF